MSNTMEKLYFTHHENSRPYVVKINDDIKSVAIYKIPKENVDDFDNTYQSDHDNLDLYTKFVSRFQ